MKYLIAGGSGLIGRALTDALKKAGHEVKWVSRRPKGEDVIGWSPAALDSGVGWADGVVNLAGEPVLGRWTQAKKKAILESRTVATRALVDAIRKAPKKPVVLLNASAIGYYGNSGENPVDETSAAADSNGLLALTCAENEAEAAKAGPAGVRVCALRTGMVLSLQGGALKASLPLAKLGLGGPLGDGAQWCSWIHIHDVVGAIMHLLATPGLRGAFNLVSPQPVTQAAYSAAVVKVLDRRMAFKIPRGLLKFMLGEGAEFMFKTQRAVPKRLLNEGFVFKFPELERALRDLLGKPQIPVYPPNFHMKSP